ncbi:unnamed protein product [Polarella glacialis]|nr:unnamed protein product [Polarella glacialis]
MASADCDTELAQLMAESSDQSEAPVARRTMTLRKAAALAVVGMVGFAALATAPGKAQLVSAKTADWVGFAAAETVAAAHTADLETLAAELAKEEASLENAVRTTEVDIGFKMKAFAEDEKKHPASLGKDMAELEPDMKQLPVGKALMFEKQMEAQEIAAMQADQAKKAAAAMADKKAAAAAVKKAEAAAKKAEEQRKKTEAAVNIVEGVRHVVDEKLEAAAKEIKDAKVTAFIKKMEAKEKGAWAWAKKLEAAKVKAEEADLKVKLAEGTKLVKAEAK